MKFANSDTVVKVINLTDSATSEVKRLIKEDGRPDIGLRLGVKGGGCSGLSYVIDFEEKKENDNVQDVGDFKIFIDKKSSLYLKDSTLEFNQGIAKRGFEFVNPNASNTCGCGESFAV